MLPVMRCSQSSARISHISSASSGLVGSTRFSVRGREGACSVCCSPCSASARAAGSGAAMSTSKTKTKVFVTCVMWHLFGQQSWVDGKHVQPAESGAQGTHGRMTPCWTHAPAA